MANLTEINSELRGVPIDGKLEVIRALVLNNSTLSCLQPNAGMGFRNDGHKEEYRAQRTTAR